MSDLDFSSISRNNAPKKPLFTVLSYDQPMNVIKFIFLRFNSLSGPLFIYRKIHTLSKMILDFDNDKKQHIKSLKELELMNQKGLKVDSNDFGYTGDTFKRELDFIHNYAVQINSFSEQESNSESKKLYERVISDLGVILSSGRIKNVFNFGVGYAHIDKQLALKFPKINFFGIERSSAAKYYNEHNNIPSNLKILEGDVLSHISSTKYSDGLFIHIRTTLLLPTQFVDELYSKLNDSGFVELYAVEQLGLSRSTGTFYEFSILEKNSELYRRHMFIHNYPNILKKYKFYIKSFDFFQTNHPNFDYRMLVINAETKLV
jgi:hypothetical protein